VRVAISLVICAVACFAALDTVTKFISTAVPMLMAVWFRYLFQALATGLALLPRRGHTLLYTAHPGLQCLRGLLLLATTVCSFFSLKHMPVGEFTAIVMLTPLVITLVAASSMGERVSPLRWLMVLGGFAGALLVIRPGGDAFGWASLLPLALVACNAAFQLLTSRLAKVDDAGTMHFYTGCVGAGVAALALPFVWQPLDGWLPWALLVAMGVFSSFGHYLLILAYGRAPSATLTPFLYFQIGFAMLIGWAVFGHAPDAWSRAGIGLIALCGAIGTWLSGHEGQAKRAATI
jgi:drug/metabolite transporter (DMT)-like permease